MPIALLRLLALFVRYFDASAAFPSQNDWPLVRHLIIYVRWVLLSGTSSHAGLQSGMEGWYLEPTGRMALYTVVNAPDRCVRLCTCRWRILSVCCK